MYDLEGVEEYNNTGALLGIDGIDGDELLGALRRMNPIARAKTINKLANTGPHSKGSRAEMKSSSGNCRPTLRMRLKGELRLADNVIYSIKQVNSKTVKMFETQDTKSIGICNVSNAKLPKNQAFLVSGITLLSGVSADLTKDKIMATNFTGIEAMPALATGEINLKSNKKQILPETSCSIFKTANFHMKPLGYYKLSNPRLILDDVLIELTVELGTMDGLQANTHIFAALHGTITTP